MEKVGGRLRERLGEGGREEEVDADVGRREGGLVVELCDMALGDGVSRRDAVPACALMCVCVRACVCPCVCLCVWRESGGGEGG